MRNQLLALLGVLALLAGLAGLTAGTGTARATTLTCTQTKAGFVTPFGCGGVQFQQFTHGILDMTADGSFWNAPVRAVTESMTNTSQDWTAFIDPRDIVPGNPPTIQGGEGDVGDYVAMFTPNGVIPGGCDTVTGPHGVCSADNNTVSSSPLDFCLSVQNIIRNVRGHLVERWVAVLRNCFGSNNPTFTLGQDKSADTQSPLTGNTVTNPNPYQVWAPVLDQANESLVNEALLSAFFRHFIGDNTRYVLDIAAGGPSGTQLLAYPANGGLNQNVKVIGCTPWLTLITGLAQVCP